MMEEFRDIPGYEGYYQISDLGNVLSMVRFLPSVIAAGRRVAKQTLMPGRNVQGRLQVTLSRDGKTRRFLVHRLVLETFVGPCPVGLEGLHNDGNHLNCRLSNLHWGTHLENMQDKARHGTERYGENSPRAKLTYNDVIEIRASNWTQRNLALKYGVSQVCIHHIRTGKTWREHDSRSD